MPYFINPVNKAESVFLAHRGDMTATEAVQARLEVAKLLATRNWSRIIADITAVPQGAEVFAVDESLPQGLPRETRIALIVRPDQTKHARLIEQVARTKGAFLTFFADAKKAEAWMRGSLLPSR